jgi:hypothetical protein
VLALNGKKPRRLLTAFLEDTDVALSLGQPVLQPARFDAGTISPALGGINYESIAG